MPTEPLKPDLPPVPAKRYFTIGEVSELCLVKQHVLRYWEQEFNQLKPMKRRGNRRYYQHHEVMLIRRIRALLYDEGFTISGARIKLDSLRGRGEFIPSEHTHLDASNGTRGEGIPAAQNSTLKWDHVRAELQAISALLKH
jgi:DNA-binding transcriptional MerR regulator